MRMFAWLGASALLVSFHVTAANCPSPDNLVANCGFDAGTAGHAARQGAASGRGW